METAGDSPSMKSTSGLSIWPRNCLAYADRDSTYRRCPSAKIVSNARLDLPEPDRPVNTIIASRGRSSETSLRLCSRAPRTTSRSATAPSSPCVPASLTEGQRTRAPLILPRSWLVPPSRQPALHPAADGPGADSGATGIVTRGSDIPPPTGNRPCESAQRPLLMPGPTAVPSSGRPCFQRTAPPWRRRGGRENIFERQTAEPARARPAGPTRPQGRLSGTRALAESKLSHALPFQCSITTKPPVLTVPTAQALVPEATATPKRLSQVAQEGFGLATRVQALPFQCRIRVLDPVSDVSV